MSPVEAARIARRIAEVEETQRDAFRAWVLHGSPATDADGLPCISSLTEAYVGKWESFDSYAHELAEDTGLLTDVPEEIARYFHWRAWISDLAMDYTVVDAPDGDAFIFQDV